MIQINGLHKSYGSQILFQDVSLTIGDQEKIGLVGRNGSGKSTFLKMLLDRDDDAIVFPEHFTISSLEQHLNFEHETLLKQVCAALPAYAMHDDWRAESLLMGLGFQQEDFEKAPGDFSSGFQIRIRLAESLISEPHLLLLDEPTNYLDILSLRWLEGFLQQWKGAFVLVTHDRHFMESVVSHTVGIHRGKMRKIEGGPKKLMDQIALEEDVYERTRVAQEKKRKKTEVFISKFRAGARSAGLVQSRIKSLEKQEIKEKLDKIPDIRFQFRSETFHGDALLKASNLSFGYDDKLLIDGFSLVVNPGERIAIVGRNGKGKSTLLNLLSGHLESQSGKLKGHVNLKQSYFGSESKAALMPNRTILEELRRVEDVKEQELRNLCGSLLFSGDASHKKISQLSGGERSRVCLGKVMLKTSHLLFLDEPTNHLDMESCQALTESLKDFPGAVVFVSHDEDMLEALATRLVVFDAGEISHKQYGYREFLERDGWSEEESEGIFKFAKPASDNKVQYLERKEQKKRLRKLQSIQEKLTKKLEELEAQQQGNADELAAACESGDPAEIERLGKKAKEIADEIQSSLTQLEEAMDEEASLA